MKEITRLAKLNKNFVYMIFVCSIIFVALFLCILLLSLHHPIVIMLTIFLVPLGTWLLVKLLFKYKENLQKKLLTKLKKLICYEIKKELESHKIDCFFDVAPSLFSDYRCSFWVSFNGIKRSTFCIHVNNVESHLNSKLKDFFSLDLLCNRTETPISNIIV